MWCIARQTPTQYVDTAPSYFFSAGSLIVVLRLMVSTADSRHQKKECCLSVEYWPTCCHHGKLDFQSVF